MDGPQGNDQTLQRHFGIPIFKGTTAFQKNLQMNKVYRKGPLWLEFLYTFNQGLEQTSCVLLGERHITTQQCAKRRAVKHMHTVICHPSKITYLDFEQLSPQIPGSSPLYCPQINCQYPTLHTTPSLQIAPISKKKCKSIRDILHTISLHSVKIPVRTIGFRTKYSVNLKLL